MFKRLFGSSGNRSVKRRGFFGRWFRKFKSVFKKQPKEITPTPRPEKLSFGSKLKNSLRRRFSDNESRKIILKQAKQKANTLKRKFDMSESQGRVLDKFIEDANKGQGHDLRLVNNLIDPEKLTESRVKKLIKQYEEGRRKKRGISYMMTKSNLSLVANKRVLDNLMDDRRAISKNLTEILKKYNLDL